MKKVLIIVASVVALYLGYVNFFKVKSCDNNACSNDSTMVADSLASVDKSDSTSLVLSDSTKAITSDSLKK